MPPAGSPNYKRVACHFNCFAYPNYSQIGHFESDALKRDLQLRSSTHNQMKAELELFPAVLDDRAVSAVIKSYEIELFSSMLCLSW